MRKLVQIAVATITDQAGREVLVLFAVDSTGSLWQREGLSGDWVSVEKPSSATATAQHRYEG